MLTFGSLFAGIGGLDLGLERAGMECKWQVEIDEFCRKVLAKHWPNVRRHDDIRTWPCVFDQYAEPEQIDVDLICGGFPCKQTSTGAAMHNKRSGLDGKDSSLWWEMLRVVEEIKPKMVVVENVAGAKTWSSEIAGGLASAGYAVAEVRVAACEFDAPHERRRLFFVADIDRERLSVAWSPGSSTVKSHERAGIARGHWTAGGNQFLRMADGLSSRVDRRERIERLGNAVVPQVAEWIGRKLVESRQD